MKALDSSGTWAVDDDEELARILAELGIELRDLEGDVSDDAVGPRPSDLDNLEDWR